VDWEHIPKNPFASRAIKTSVPSTKSNVEVPRETIEAILEHCDPTWAAIVGLSRYGGLRTPSETLSLKWGDIDFENRRMSIPEPKVERHEGRGVRSCSMFPELAPLLEKLFAEATQTLGHHPSREDYVIGKDAYRKAAMRTGGWANSNLRTQFLKLLRRAGVAPWPRLFHSMRATRQTELERSFPLHVVCSWLGNPESIARKSYLLLTESDFEKAIQSQKLPDAKADAPAVLEESKTLEICDAKGEAAGSRTEPHQSEKTQQNTRVFIDFPSENSHFSAEGTGPWKLILTWVLMRRVRCERAKTEIIHDAGFAGRTARSQPLSWTKEYWGVGKAISACCVHFKVTLANWRISMIPPSLGLA
jgi:hypothetical protein